MGGIGVGGSTERGDNPIPCVISSAYITIPSDRNGEWRSDLVRKIPHRSSLRYYHKQIELREETDRNILR